MTNFPQEHLRRRVKSTHAAIGTGAGALPHHFVFLGDNVSAVMEVIRAHLEAEVKSGNAHQAPTATLPAGVGETTVYRDALCSSWTCPLDARTRPLVVTMARHHLSSTTATVLLVDSTLRNGEDWHTARLLVHRFGILLDRRDLALLVLANKQDEPGAQPVKVIADLLRLPAFRGGRVPWCVHAVVASTGAGLFEALEWLLEVGRRAPDFQRGAPAIVGSDISPACAA